MYALVKKTGNKYSMLYGYFNSRSALAGKQSKYDYVISYNKEKEVKNMAIIDVRLVWRQSALDKLEQAANDGHPRIVESILKEYEVLSGCVSCELSDAELISFVKLQLSKLKESAK